jgi:hypothetical protein
MHGYLGVGAMAALLATSGCALRPQLVKHHKDSQHGEVEGVTLTVQGGTAAPTEVLNLLDGAGYSVTAFVTAAPPGPASTPFISKLSDQGQAALIEKVATATTSPDELAGALLKLGEKPVKACGEPGPLRFERRLVLSMAGRHADPATRFDGVAYVLKLDQGSPAKFVSWNRFETLHESVALGTTRMKQSQNVGWKDFDSEKTTAAATAIAPAKELLSTVDLTASQSRELEETVASSRRFTPITGTLSGPGASLVQQGAVGLDLFGNLTADFTIELDEVRGTSVATEWIYATTGLFEKAGAAQTKADQITLSRCQRKFATSLLPITASLDAGAVLRQVKKGADTVIEGDDTAFYASLKSQGAAKVELVDRASLLRVFFVIKRVKKDYNLQDAVEGEDMRFASLDEARTLVRWLRHTQSTELKGVQFRWAGTPDGGVPMPLLKKGDAANMEVQRCETIDAINSTCGVVWQ